MRRVAIFLIILTLLAMPVSAFSGITDAKSDSIVSADGSCQVTLTLQLTLDENVAPAFPLPEDARDVTVNGKSTDTTVSGAQRWIALQGIAAAPGSSTLVIGYRLEDVITLDGKDGLSLQLELLSGFSYPIDALEFCITLPGEAESEPFFTSSYYQETVQTMLTVTREGQYIRGSIHTRLQDHEMLSMTLPVTQEMFPQPAVKRWSMDTLDLVMICLAVLAVLYWLFFLRCAPLRRMRRTTAPDGITAGQIPCRLTQQGVDLTLTVLSWAQLGYLLIQPTADGRVLLHKRMDMGNERSEFENKWFKKLFGRRSVVDGTGQHYSLLCQKISRFCPGLSSNFLPLSGSPRVFRMLCAAVSGVSGVSLAAAYSGGSSWEIPLAIVLAICGCITGWLVQNMIKALHGRTLMPLLPGVLAAALWTWLSIGAGEWNVALALLPAQLAAGLAALYGGRRTQTGQISAGEILGLRHYLRSMNQEELSRNLAINPQYFYDIAPWALALGVDDSLARMLRKTQLPECHYLTTGMDGHMTGRQWHQLLRSTVRTLDAARHRAWLERLTGR